MISPEILRRYPWFGPFNDSQIKAMAMLAEAVSAQANETLIETGQPADTLFLLVQGSVDLIHVVEDRDQPGLRREQFLSELSPGEVFGISALIEPHVYTLNARAAEPSELVRLRGDELRAMCQDDLAFAYHLMRQTAQTASSRLRDARVLLAAARA
jgi:CRP-like cAMP-binding protein